MNINTVGHSILLHLCITWITCELKKYEVDASKNVNCQILKNQVRILYKTIIHVSIMGLRIYNFLNIFSQNSYFQI